MLQQLIEKAGREYKSMARNVREYARDVRYGAGELGYTVSDALDNATLRLESAAYSAAETVEAVRGFTDEAIAGYRETREAMDNIRSLLAIYDSLDSEDLDKIQLGMRLIDQIEAIRSNVIPDTAIATGVVAYFVTHPNEHLLFCAIDTFYLAEE